MTRKTARSARLVWQRFATRSLQLFRRTDTFPREMVGFHASALTVTAPQDDRHEPRGSPPAG